MWSSLRRRRTYLLDGSPVAFAWPSGDAPELDDDQFDTLQRCLASAITTGDPCARSQCGAAGRTGGTGSARPRCATTRAPCASSSIGRRRRGSGAAAVVLREVAWRSRRAADRSVVQAQLQRVQASAAAEEFDATERASTAASPKSTTRCRGGGGRRAGTPDLVCLAGAARTTIATVHSALVVVATRSGV